MHFVILYTEQEGKAFGNHLLMWLQSLGFALVVLLYLFSVAGAEAIQLVDQCTTPM